MFTGSIFVDDTADAILAIDAVSAIDALGGIIITFLDGDIDRTGTILAVGPIGAGQPDMALLAILADNDLVCRHIFIHEDLDVALIIHFCGQVIRSVCMVCLLGRTLDGHLGT